MPASREIRPRNVFMSALVASVFVLGACSDDSSSGTAADTSVSMGPSMGAESPMEDAMSTSFGSGCAAIPQDGSGSLEGMAQTPVATAASNNPILSTLVTAVGEAGLVDTLNGAENITVFAPTDDAFAALPKKTLDAALADPKGLLTTVLTYHVVDGQLTPDQLAGNHRTLEGAALTVDGSGETFTVDGKAGVICGNVQTANATVYIIDQVLIPPMAR